MVILTNTLCCLSEALLDYAKLQYSISNETNFRKKTLANSLQRSLSHNVRSRSQEEDVEEILDGISRLVKAENTKKHSY